MIYSKNLPQGHTLTQGDLDYARPLNLDIMDAETIIGKKLSRSVNAYTTVSAADLGN